MAQPRASQELRVAFLHPDLGIGGAERLVVDAACGIQARGHSVTVFTAHCDPGHCFDEARDGTLDVRVHGDWLPRTVFGRLMALCAIVRMIWAALVLSIRGDRFDVVVVDQVAAAVPLLRLLTRARVLFYCHYPDLLLTARPTRLKRIYRWPLDTLEEASTAAAHKTLVNSEYTRGVFGATFKSIRTVPDVLYPALNLGAFDDWAASHAEPATRTVILSINRFERKKNIMLAVEAFAVLRDQCAAARAPGVTLVLAGGYDPRVAENVEYHAEIEARVDALGLTDAVSLRRSISNDEKNTLLSDCLFLVYTPHNEHFGIVPIEANYAGRGGPTESIVDGKTGFLCSQTPAAFAAAMQTLLEDPGRREEMGKAGRGRVRDRFSLDALATNLEAYMLELLE